MPIRPMKGVLVTEANKAFVTWPKDASYKLDGIRGLVSDSTCYSTSGKPLPSLLVQERAAQMPNGLDGEWVYGDPAAEGCLELTKSAVMSRHWPSKLEKHELRFYAFEVVSSMGSFRNNHGEAILKTHPVDQPWIVVTEQFELSSLEEFEALYEEAISLGYEGLVLRDPNRRYKQGRATEREDTFWKAKPFAKELFEAVILDWKPLYINTNESEDNAFGLSKKSSHAENKVPTDELGAFFVRDLKTKQEFWVGGGKGLTIALRQKLFKMGDKLRGRIIQYTCMTYGEVNTRKQPSYRGFRDELDMTEY